MENVISEWRKLEKVKKFEAIKQLQSLYESEQMEQELSETVPEDKAALGGTHSVICADFLLQSTVDEIIKNDLCPNLIFTSPPYNMDLDYGKDFDDKKSIDAYIEFIKTALLNCDKVLKEGGRIAINIRDIPIGKGSRYPIIVPMHKNLCEYLGYTYRGLHIWYKGREESSMGWGSFKKSSSPAIIDLYEYIFVFQKGDYLDGQDDIGKTEFIENVLGIWKIRPVKKISGKNKTNSMSHPCPFPIELARRIIKLYSHVGDTVLDPFSGVFSTSIAAAQSGRNSVGIEINKDFCNCGITRLNNIGTDIFGNVTIKKMYN